MEKMNYKDILDYIGGAFGNYAQRQSSLTDMMRNAYQTGDVNPELINEISSYMPMMGIMKTKLPQGIERRKPETYKDIFMNFEPTKVSSETEEALKKNLKDYLKYFNLE